MRNTRIIMVPLAALLGAAILAGPAAAVPADSTPTTSTAPNTGASTVQGSRSDGQNLRSPDAKDTAKANVYVPPAELWPGRVTTPAVVAPANLRPIVQPTAAASAPSAGFDWGSAGIGAAAAIGACAIALAGAAGMRRRRPEQPRSVATH